MANGYDAGKATGTQDKNFEDIFILNYLIVIMTLPGAPSPLSEHLLVAKVPDYRYTIVEKFPVQKILMPRNTMDAGLTQEQQSYLMKQAFTRAFFQSRYLINGH
ncbi:MAG: hypothetical protein WC379_07610 [Methanoregula sp.]|jgi:hypothetical protein